MMTKTHFMIREIEEKFPSLSRRRISYIIKKHNIKTERVSYRIMISEDDLHLFEQYHSLYLQKDQLK